jgi:ribonuclease E
MGRKNMKKEMLINVLQPEECRIAVLEDGVLEELYVERTSHESYVGNIYKGRIVNIEPSIQAAFVDFGVGRNGFLHVSDVEPAYYKHLESRRPDSGRRGNGRDRFRGPGGGPDRERGRDRGRPSARSEYDQEFEETPPGVIESSERNLDVVEPTEAVEEIVDVEVQTSQFGLGVLDDPAEISLIGEPPLLEKETASREAESDELGEADADVTPVEQPAEEEEEAPRSRRRTRGGSRRRRGRSSKKNKSEPESGKGHEDSASSEKKPDHDDGPPKPRLMDSAERRTEEGDEENESSSSSALDDDLFFPRSEPTPPPASKPVFTAPAESYTTEEPVAEEQPSFGGRENELGIDEPEAILEKEIKEDLIEAEEFDKAQVEEEQAEEEETSEDQPPRFDEDLDEEPQGRSRRDRRSNFDDDFDDEQRRRPRHGDNRRGRPQNGRRGFSRPGMGRPKPLIQDIFKRGQEVLVQVIKEGIGTKGPTLSTYISIAGRYLVLMPGLNRVGVSRKIVDDEQRRRLREIFNELQPPKGLGFIIRTAGIDKNKKELQNDLAYLSRLWQVVARRIRKVKAPAEIYQESDMITRTIRDIFSGDIDTILVDEPGAYEHAKEFLQIVMPRYANRIKLYDDPSPLFHKYKIEDEILRIQQRHVPLPNGGSIVIDQTEALVAIDVNSGNFRADNNAEETAYQMNLLAAKEIARQLRLRDLGGVIANDFIDMRDDKHRRSVERAMREAVKRDRARTKVLRISQFGIIEMTRQRIRPSLKRSIYRECAHCHGTGHVKTGESMSIEVMRMLQLAANRGNLRQINVKVTEEVAIYLLNKKRKEIAKLEDQGGIQVHITGVPGAAPETLEFACFDGNNNEVKLLPQAEEFKPRRR